MSEPARSPSAHGGRTVSGQPSGGGPNAHSAARTSYSLCPPEPRSRPMSTSELTVAALAELRLESEELSQVSGTTSETCDSASSSAPCAPTLSACTRTRGPSDPGGRGAPPVAPVALLGALYAVACRAEPWADLPLGGRGLAGAQLQLGPAVECARSGRPRAARSAAADVAMVGARLISLPRRREQARTSRGPLLSADRYSGCATGCRSLNGGWVSTPSSHGLKLEQLASAARRRPLCTTYVARRYAL